jgi:hypothetical protein
MRLDISVIPCWLTTLLATVRCSKEMLSAPGGHGENPFPLTHLLPWQGKPREKEVKQVLSVLKDPGSDPASLGGENAI